MSRITNIALGICVEIIYALSFILVGFLICFIIYWGIFGIHAF